MGIAQKLKGRRQFTTRCCCQIKVCACQLGHTLSLALSVSLASASHQPRSTEPNNQPLESTLNSACSHSYVLKLVAAAAAGFCGDLQDVFNNFTARSARPDGLSDLEFQTGRSAKPDVSLLKLPDGSAVQLCESPTVAEQLEYAGRYQCISDCRALVSMYIRL